MIKIYGNRRSRATRCMWLLEEIGTPYELIPIDPANGDNRTPGYLALNPSGKMPVLEADGVVMSESHAINLWLAQRAGGEFWPDDAWTKGRILQWTLWTGAELEPVTTGILRAKRAGGADADGRIAELQEAAKVLIGLVEIQLKDAPFLAGEAFSVADVSVGSVVAFFAFFGIDLGPFPQTSSWFARLQSRPAYQRVFASA